MDVRRVDVERIKMNKIRNRIEVSQKQAYERLMRYQEQRTINLDCYGEIGQKYYALQDVVKPAFKKLTSGLKNLLKI